MTDNLPTVRNQIDWTPEQVQLLQDTIAKGTTADEFKMFLMVCKQTGLNPFMRQIHIVKRWDAKLQRESATVQVAIDGFRVVADRSGEYAGQDEPKFAYKNDNERCPVSCTVTVYRIVHGQRVPFTATAFMDEYIQTKKDGTPTAFWASKPRLMLAKCAESQALRKAFPQDLSGLYTDDEMPEHVDTHTGEISTKPAKTATVETAPAGEANPQAPPEVKKPDMFDQLKWIQLAEDVLAVDGMKREDIAKLCISKTGKNVDQVDSAKPFQIKNYIGALKGELSKRQLEVV